VKGDKMTRNKKEELVKFFSDEFAKSEAVLIASFKGLSVVELESLRNMAREKEVLVKVSKNTLINLALKNNNLEIEGLKETNIFLWAKDQMAACKVAVDFEKANDKFILKYAILEKNMASLDSVRTLASLPGKDELIAMLLSVWNGPARSFVTGLDNLKKKKEEEQ
jgi:large subunit ribosomal protein L10